VKLVTYAAARDARVGVLMDDGVHDAGFEGDMVALIEAGPAALRAAGAAAARNPAVPAARLLAPLRPRSMRDFMAFEGHLRGALGRLGRPIPEEWYTVPAYYRASPDTVIGPETEIRWPAFTDRLDHELELAAIIGRPGHDIPRKEALAHVFGWTIWNDVSARDVQVRELPLSLGPAKAKEWDGSNVLGPCLVTADEVDGTNLRLRVRVNGELWGEDTTANMHHTFADLIAYCSRGQTLYPGDLLGSGTLTGGSGIELDRWLRPGDLVEMEADGIGILRNRIGRKEER